MGVMKNTGVAWIGEIPLEWKLGKVKYGFDRKKEKSTEKDPVVLSLARAGVRVRDISTNEGQLAASYEGYNPVEPNDLLLNPMDLISGANCSISHVSGVISPAYMNLRARNGFDPRYYDYFFKTQYWSLALFAHGKGVSFDNRWTLNESTLRDYFIPIPSYQEQQAIADYLDDRCSKIDEIIAEATASIEEYKELKQAVIFESVTKGLDKNAPMKDSGYSCIGKIPETWFVGKLKNIVDISDGTHDTPAYVNSDRSFPLVTPKCITDGVIDVSLAGQISEEDYIEINKRSYVKKYDVLMTMIGSTVGNCAVVVNDPEYAIKNIALLRTHGSYCLGKFVFYLLNCNVFRFQYEMDSHSTAQAFISQSMLKNLAIPIPTDWNGIVIYLDKEVGKIDALIHEKHEVIEALQNYKKSLIYEVVTGKKRVIV